MATPRKSPARKRPEPAAPASAPRRSWQDYSKIAVVVATGLGAVIFIYNTTAPVVDGIRDSGPLPVAARAEVEALRAQGEARFKTVDEGLQQTLETAKAALDAAGDAKRQSLENRMRRLLEQQKEFQARLDAAPNDRLFRELLETNQAEIQKMLDEAKVAK